MKVLHLRLSFPYCKGNCNIEHDTIEETAENGDTALVTNIKEKNLGVILFVSFKVVSDIVAAKKIKILK